MLSQSKKVIIAKRIAEELEEGSIVNLGVGIPTKIPDYLDGKNVHLHSENGLIGIGPKPSKENLNMDLISASKNPITMEKGAAIFDSASSFAMIRGGHIDVAVLGILQVDKFGEISNWSIPGEPILGVGGAIDLIAGANKIYLASIHQSKYGEPKLIEKLTYPSSGVRRADKLFTEHAVFRFTEEGPELIEIISDISLEELFEITGTDFTVNLPERHRTQIN
ncbi:3-oxoacid CoA-transferase subunit B [Oceanobacillus longus]|uniref:3-oxoacid CoA-transferase subunit B n=1 Tax=Oceanobacillus longus TaxID=930120 RepID=A0ABV8H055_9BACI